MTKKNLDLGLLTPQRSLGESLGTAREGEYRRVDAVHSAEPLHTWIRGAGNGEVLVATYAVRMAWSMSNAVKDSVVGRLGARGGSVRDGGA